MKVFVSYKLRGLDRSNVLGMLSSIRNILNDAGTENFIYDLDHPNMDPDQNRDYFTDALPQIKAADEIWVLHNHHEDSIGMMMEISAGYALGKPIVIWRETNLDEHKPYNIDQCAHKVFLYDDLDNLKEKISSCIGGLS